MIMPDYDAFFNSLKQAAFESQARDGYGGLGTSPNESFSIDGPGSNLSRRLTGSQREANAFTASEASLAFKREMYADSTRYQRAVSDMQAAGINPMLAASGIGGSSVSASAGSSVTPSDNSQAFFSNLIELQSLALQVVRQKAEIQNIKADTALKDTQAKQNTENTRGARLRNDFYSDTSTLQKILLGDEHELNEVKKEVDKMDAETRRKIQEQQKENLRHYNDYLDAQEELAREDIKNMPLQRAVLRSIARENNASAAYKSAMQEVDYKLAEAKTESEKESLELLKLEAKFKEGIYTPTYIAAIGKAAQSEADMRECTAAYQRGDYHLASKSMQKMLRKLEKDAKEGNFSTSSQYFGMSNNGAAAASVLIP